MQPDKTPSDPTIPEGHVQLVSPRGALLTVEDDSADHEALLADGWLLADSDEGRARIAAKDKGEDPAPPAKEG